MKIKFIFNKDHQPITLDLDFVPRQGEEIVLNIEEPEEDVSVFCTVSYITSIIDIQDNYSLFPVKKSIHIVNVVVNMVKRS